MTEASWSTPQTLSLYVVALVVIGVLDAVWLGWLAKGLYKAEMGSLMAESPRVVPALLFYLAYPAALIYFAVAPVQDAATGATVHAFWRAAALGLTAYGTYDLTNMSVVKGFSVRLALVDVVWGAFASGVGGATAFAVVKWWAQRG